MPEIHVIAVFSPKPDKSERLTAVLKTMCDKVHATEPDTPRFLMTTEITASDPNNPPDIILIEKYASQAANDKHITEPQFHELFKAIEEEGLLRNEVYLRKSVASGGFEER